MTSSWKSQERFLQPGEQITLWLELQIPEPQSEAQHDLFQVGTATPTAITTATTILVSTASLPPARVLNRGHTKVRRCCRNRSDRCTAGHYALRRTAFGSNQQKRLCERLEALRCFLCRQRDS